MFINFLIYLFVFLLGLCIGSFLNCVIYRLEQSKTLKGRSFCPCCKHKLSWKDLFPFFSFIFLGGKCRYCHKKISIQYPVLELATGALFLIIFNLKFGISNQFEIVKFLNLILWFYIVSVLVVVFVYDLKHYLIPDAVLLPAITITGVYRFVENLAISRWDLAENFKLGVFNPAAISNYLLAIIIAAGFFLIIWFVSGGKWMGFGDVELAVLMGIILGLPAVLVALFLAFFSGAIIGVILMVFGTKNMKSQIPFGPFLVLGTFLSLSFNQQIISWYTHLFLI